MWIRKWFYWRAVRTTMLMLKQTRLLRVGFGGEESCHRCSNLKRQFPTRHQWHKYDAAGYQPFSKGDFVTGFVLVRKGMVYDYRRDKLPICRWSGMGWGEDWITLTSWERGGTELMTLFMCPADDDSGGIDDSKSWHVGWGIGSWGGRGGWWKSWCQWVYCRTLTPPLPTCILLLLLRLSQWWWDNVLLPLPEHDLKHLLHMCRAEEIASPCPAAKILKHA